MKTPVPSLDINNCPTLYQFLRPECKRDAQKLSTINRQRIIRNLGRRTLSVHNELVKINPKGSRFEVERNLFPMDEAEDGRTDLEFVTTKGLRLTKIRKDVGARLFTTLKIINDYKPGLSELRQTTVDELTLAVQSSNGGEASLVVDFTDEMHTFEGGVVLNAEDVDMLRVDRIRFFDVVDSCADIILSAELALGIGNPPLSIVD